GAVYALNLKTPPELHLGVLYVIPVLLASWHDGMAWGIVFGVATSVLRFLVGIDQLPPTTTLTFRTLNEASYLAVVAVAIAGLSQLRQTQAQLERAATNDPLTNVHNARAFSEELAQELGRNRRYGRPLALIYLDLDDFKKVNDAHGHATGDAVLRLVADAMRGAVRQADVVGTLGGDEFGVLMPETDGDVARAAETRRFMARRGAWTCFITLTSFALGGSLIFRLFGITIAAFKIAGGVLIGLNALDMVQARRSQQKETPVEKAEGIQKEDVGIMPLGVPMLAGPGAISTVMVLAGASKSPVTTIGVYAAIALT